MVLGLPSERPLGTQGNSHLKNSSCYTLVNLCIYSSNKSSKGSFRWSPIVSIEKSIVLLFTRNFFMPIEYVFKKSNDLFKIGHYDYSLDPTKLIKHAYLLQLRMVILTKILKCHSDMM